MLRETGLGLPCAQFIWNLLEVMSKVKKMIRKKEEIEEERRKNAAKAPVACVSERIFVLALNRVLAHYLCKYPAGMR